MEGMSRPDVLERPTAGGPVVGEPTTPIEPVVDRPARLEARFPYLLDLRSGLCLFVVFAGFALSPLGQHVDRLTHLRPLRPGMAAFPLFRDYLDHIASQGGEGLVMAGVAVAMVFVMRSSLPLVIVGLTEGLFYFTGLVKLLFAKDAPRFGTPSYWEGGYLTHGKFGMAFPSGHTTEVVLVFGALVLLLHVGVPGWSARHAGLVKAVWVVVALNAAVVSWSLGTHWLTDLVGGLIFGGIVLRCLVASVSRGYLPWVADKVDDAVVASWSYVAGLRLTSWGRARAARSDRPSPPAGRDRFPLTAGRTPRDLL